MNIIITVFSVLVVIGVLIGILYVLLIIKSKLAVKEVPLPYRSKRYFFSRSEQQFLSILHEKIDRNKYLIFPKVRLADFIEVTVKGKEYQGWWNKIRSKHVDSLVWDIAQNKITLAIELDGKSHNTEKMKIRDEFVEKLYKTVGVRLERVEVGSDFSASLEVMIKSLGEDLNSNQSIDS